MEVWNRLLVLSIGGALGVNSRYWLGVLISRWSGPRFPWATIVINVTGSFAIGFLAVILAHRWPDPLGRLFVVTGFLGGYTTFSSFTFESLKLWEDGDKTLSLANTFGSVAAGLAAVTLGVALGRAVIGSPSESERLVQNRPTAEERAEADGLPPESFLEGRRLMAAAPSAVGIKEMTQKGYTELDVIGTNKGDTITINDNGSSAVGNVTVSVANGATYTSRGNISIIKVQDGSGNDNVTYNLTGTLTAPQTVLINLGNGNNHFIGNIAGAINTVNGLDLEAYGGSGNDNLIVNQTGLTQAGTFVPYLEGGAGKNTLTYNGSGNISAGASVSPEYAGGTGTDTILSNYSGQIDGNYMYNLSVGAGSGTENITNNVFVGAGSTGTVGTSSTSPAAIKAGKGNDTIRFAIASDPTSTAQINAAILAGSGKDVISRTSNVVLQGKTSRTKDTVLS